MGNSGIKLKIPLTATGSTAPEANLETVEACPRAGVRRPDAAACAVSRERVGSAVSVSRGDAVSRLKDGQSAPAVETQRELSSTAEAVPPR